MTKAQLWQGMSDGMWTTWWLVDKDGNLLNTEPVCKSLTDTKWHPWFEKELKNIEIVYPGVKASPDNVGKKIDDN